MESGFYVQDLPPKQNKMEDLNSVVGFFFFLRIINNLIKLHLPDPKIPKLNNNKLSLTSVTILRSCMQVKSFGM